MLASVVLAAVLAVAASRGLHADGAAFLYRILGDDWYFVANVSRLLDYLITQTPVVVALRGGVSDIKVLNALFNLGIVLPAPILLLVAIWLARGSMLLLGGTAIVVASVYYPPALFHVGEFNYAYAATWLAFVLVMRKTRRSAITASVLAATLLACYATALFLGPLLAAIALMARREAPTFARAWMGLAAVLFGVSFLTSVYFLLHLPPSEASAAAQFRDLLIDRQSIQISIGVFGFSVAAFAAAILLPGPVRFAAAPLLLALAIGLFFFAMPYRLNSAAFGIPYDQRSAAFVFLFVTIAATWLLSRWKLDFRPDLAGTLVVAVPLISAAAIDVTSTIGWSRYLGEFCAELRGPAASIDPQEFNQRRRSLRYGWTWTNPMLSALVRPAESNAVVPNPGQPVEAAAEAVSGFGVRYKSRGSICAAAS